jgi:hypothetical protein
MIKKNFILSFILSFILFNYTNCIAQNQKKTLFEKQFLAKTDKLEIKLNADLLYKYNLNIEKYDEFKNIGIDLKTVAIHPKNIYEESLFSSNIIVGTIVERKYLSGNQNYFHTVYKILVDKVLKGDVKKEYIYLKTISGFKNLNSDVYIRVANEPTLFLGEKALFMLNKIDFEGIEIEKTVNLDTKVKTINATKDDFQLFRKFTIKNEIIFNHWKKKINTLDSVIYRIKKVELVNETNKLLKKKLNKTY